MAEHLGPIVRLGYSVRGQANGAHVKHHYCGGTSAFSYAGSSLLFFFFYLFFFYTYLGVLRHLAMPVRPSCFFFNIHSPDVRAIWDAHICGGSRMDCDKEETKTGQGTKEKDDPRHVK